MKEFWENFFKFLKDILPSFLLGFGLGKKTADKENAEANEKLAKVTYEFEKIKNKMEVEAANKGKSDIDIVNDIIKK